MISITKTLCIFNISGMLSEERELETEKINRNEVFFVSFNRKDLHVLYLERQMLVAIFFQM